MRRLALPLALAALFGAMPRAPQPPAAPRGEIDLNQLRRDLRGIRLDQEKVKAQNDAAKRAAFDDARRRAEERAREGQR